MGPAEGGSSPLAVVIGGSRTVDVAKKPARGGEAAALRSVDFQTLEP
jgi:hypothetical protein